MVIMDLMQTTTAQRDQRPHPTILVIDDDIGIRTAQSRWMRSQFLGGRVLLADSPSAAIAVLATDPVDAVVTDLEFSGTNQLGTDVLAWVKKNRPNLEQFVLFLTGRPDLVPPNTPNVFAKGSIDDLRGMRATLCRLLPW